MSDAEEEHNYVAGSDLGLGLAFQDGEIVLVLATTAERIDMSTVIPLSGIVPIATSLLLLAQQGAAVQAELEHMGIEEIQAKLVEIQQHYQAMMN